MWCVLIYIRASAATGNSCLTAGVCDLAEVLNKNTNNETVATVIRVRRYRVS